MPRNLRVKHSKKEVSMSESKQEIRLKDRAGPNLALHEGASLISQFSFVVHDLANKESFFQFFNIVISRSKHSRRPSPCMFAGHQDACKFS